MQRPANTKAHRTLEVAPPIRVEAPWRVVELKTLPGFRLRVTFVDGTEGEVAMSEFLASACVIGTVFEGLRDPATFAQAAVVLGTAHWPTGADLAPDAMYDAICKDGRWVVQPS